MAFVMIAGPQILSAIFLATTKSWLRDSAAYVAGAALSITLIATIAFFVGSGASDSGTLTTRSTSWSSCCLSPPRCICS